MNYRILSSLFVGIMMSLTFAGMAYTASEGSRIDMAVSPIRDEFTAIPGVPSTRTVQYTNNSDVPYAIYMTIEDCQPSGNYGTPICKKQTGTGVDSEFSSTWISIDGETSFTVPPKGSRIISYTINVPEDAAPGGHYGAIFFNNPDSLNPTTNAVGMIRRIGMLYMMKVPGVIRVDTGLGDVLVDGPSGLNTESTPEFNSAPTPIDKILQKVWKGAPMWDDIIKEINPLWDKPMLEKDNFVVTLQIPVKNDGNIHVRPTGKIFLYDEDGTQLEKIGKESIVDENGVYVGEMIVDYLPINDERGSVLPNTERTFRIDWYGFGYEERDPLTGNMDIKFESPGSYYTRLSEEGAQFIYPWEKLSIRKMRKTLTAKVEFTYNDIVKNEDITQTMDVPVSVSYRYITKTLNYGMLFALGFIIFFAWLFIRKRDKKIEKLEETNEELYDEISVLEHAKKHIAVTKRVKNTPVKKTISKKKAPVKPKTSTKTEEKKTLAKHTPKTNKKTTESGKDTSATENNVE